MKTQMTVGMRFVLSSSVPLALMAILGVTSLNYVNVLSRSVDTIVADPLPGVYRASQLDSLVFQFRGDTWKHISFPDAAGKSAIERNQQNVKEKIEDHFRNYEETITAAEDRALFERARPLYERYIQIVESVVLPLSRDGKSEEARAAYLQQADPVHAELKKVLSAVVALKRLSGENDSAAAAAAATRARTITLLLLVAAFAAGGAFVLFSVRSVNRSLRRAVADLSEGAEQVASAASQVSISSQSLAHGSSEQAAALEETSASGDEVSSSARKNTESGRSAAALVTRSQEEFVQTNRTLDETVVAMGEIDAQSEKISKIIKVIDEIAFQTNILALNAAVEAARAGEAGMGFAVVADEVRTLSQRCAQAARDTTVLIEESVAKSKDGKDKVDQVVAAIRTVTMESGKVKTLVDEMSQGSQEQSRGIEQIARALTQMEQVTQTTAASAEEGASAAEELTAQSETLKDIVGRLTQMVGGVGAIRPSASSRNAAAEMRRPEISAARQTRFTSGLSALHSAVSHRASSDRLRPVVASAKAQHVLPLEEESREF